MTLYLVTEVLKKLQTPTEKFTTAEAFIMLLFGMGFFL